MSGELRNRNGVGLVVEQEASGDGTNMGEKMELDIIIKKEESGVNVTAMAACENVTSPVTNKGVQCFKELWKCGEGAIDIDSEIIIEQPSVVFHRNETVVMGVRMSVCMSACDYQSVRTNNDPRWEKTLKGHEGIDADFVHMGWLLKSQQALVSENDVKGVRNSHERENSV